MFTINVILRRDNGLIAFKVISHCCEYCWCLHSIVPGCGRNCNARFIPLILLCLRLWLRRSECVALELSSDKVVILITAEISSSWLCSNQSDSQKFFNQIKSCPSIYCPPNFVYFSYFLRPGGLMMIMLLMHRSTAVVEKINLGPWKICGNAWPWLYSDGQQQVLFEVYSPW